MFQKSEGLCTQQIEVVLQKPNVQRQAYHEKSFVGNHVHKMLKEKSILELCNSIPILIHKNGFSGTTLHEKSIEVSNKFKQLFSKFSKYYHIFSSKKINPGELTQLRNINILIFSAKKILQIVTKSMYSIVVVFRMFEKFGLRVDEPKVGGSASGTSNTGNLCTKAFSDPLLLSKILEMDEKIIRLHYILIANNCKDPNDPEKIDKSCNDTYKKLLKIYDWFKFPASILKV
nr:uncharacterized protein LOC124814081 [Hydra vulgaris]